MLNVFILKVMARVSGASLRQWYYQKFKLRIVVTFEMRTVLSRMNLFNDYLLRHGHLIYMKQK